MNVFELKSTPALVWWQGAAAEGWMSLEHLCGGLNRDELQGWVLPIEVPDSCLPLLWKLDSQDFARGYRSGNLDYEVADEHRAAYTTFLAEHGLKPGDLAMLKQAVYPIDAGNESLRTLGLAEAKRPQGAALLVLGWNNH